MTKKEYKHNYRFTLAYEGTAYSGWQVQPNTTTIQELLEKTIKIITKEKISVIGSGRTDAGVHALAQVASFRCDNPITKRRFLASANGILPQDIRILKVEEVPADFHARFSAKSKCYHYHLFLDPIQLPFSRRYSWHIHQAFDVELLKEATKIFIGEHDFTSFANEAHTGSAARNPVRNLVRIDVVEEEGGVRLEFEANGFLYKMVRNLVGTLVDVATGRRTYEEVKEILLAKDRRKAGKAAPANGLFLAYVVYNDSTSDISSNEGKQTTP